MRRSAPGAAVDLYDKAQWCLKMKWTEQEFDSQRAGWLEFMTNVMQMTGGDKMPDVLEELADG